MSIGFAPTVSGIPWMKGTLQSSLADTLVPVAPSANTVMGDLMVLVIMVTDAAAVDLSTIADNGDGWVLLSHGFDGGGSPFSLGMWGKIADRNGATGYSDFNLGTDMIFISQIQNFRLTAPFRFDLGMRGRDEGAFLDASSSTTMTAPKIHQPYAQILQLTACGYDNGGSAITLGGFPGDFHPKYNETLTSPPLGIQLSGDYYGAKWGFTDHPAVDQTASSAVTLRASVRCHVPIVGNNMPLRHRYGQSRRVG